MAHMHEARYAFLILSCAFSAGAVRVRDFSLNDYRGPYLGLSLTRFKNRLLILPFRAARRELRSRDDTFRALRGGRGPCPPAPSLRSFLYGFSLGRVRMGRPFQRIVGHPKLRGMVVYLPGEAAGA